MMGISARSCCIVFAFLPFGTWKGHTAGRIIAAVDWCNTESTELWTSQDGGYAWALWARCSAVPWCWWDFCCPSDRCCRSFQGMRPLVDDLWGLLSLGSWKRFPVNFPLRMLRLRKVSDLNCMLPSSPVHSRSITLPGLMGDTTVTSSIKPLQVGCLRLWSAYRHVYCSPAAFKQ